MENNEPEFLHDIYLTFRGHARHGIFTGNLKCALSQKRFRTFMNDEATLSGDQISPFKAIEQSRMSIVVFSPKDPDSTWNFEELVKIVECRTKNQIVWPIFYKVAPSTVRNLEKKYGAAMAKHEKEFGKDSDKVKKWKQALSEIANLETGIKPFKDGNEYEYIQKIVEMVAQSLPRYKIFLSFRGKDTRYSFTGFLNQALQREGLKTFMDDEVLEGGDHIPLFLINAIETSRLSIVVLSEKYADSKWCLDELVKILECAKTKNQLVWPIFYKVKPSDVRDQSNSYYKPMTAHEKKYGKDSEKVSKWRSALTEIAEFTGWELEAKQYEYDLIEKVVKKAIIACSSPCPSPSSTVEKAIASDNFLCMPSPCPSPCPSPSSSPIARVLALLWSRRKTSVPLTFFFFLSLTFSCNPLLKLLQ